MKQIIRGDVIYVDLGQHPKTSIQSGVRPCVVVSNNKNNKFSKNINICPCTTKVDKKQIPTHILVNPSDVKGYFEKRSVIMIEQITVVGKKAVISKVGHIPNTSELMKKINKALKKQLDV